MRMKATTSGSSYKFNFWHLVLFGVGIFAYLAVTMVESTTQKHIRDLKGSSKQRIKRRAIDSDDTDEIEMNDFNETEPEGPTKRITSKIKYEPFVLPKGYNKLQIPDVGYVAATNDYGFLTSSEYEIFDDWAHPITVTLRIRHINDVDELEEEIVFSADLILQWVDRVLLHDARSKFNATSEEVESDKVENLFKTLDPDFLTKIWKPDIYIENLVKVQHPEVMSQPITVRVNEVTGEIVYISRLRIRLECEMDFHYYPADTQTCEVELRSNSYDKDELNLEWGEPHGVYLEDCGGPNFDFQVEDVADGEHEEGYIGNKTRLFSGLGFNIVARRKISYHMVQTFLPSIFFIIITWLCFLVPSRMVEARIGISMTTLLTLTAMFASVRENSPTVSYVRAIDIWMVACIFFVFLTLLEFAVLVWLKNMKEELDTADEEEKAKHQRQQATVESDKQTPNGLESSTVNFKPAAESDSNSAQNREMSSFAEALKRKKAQQRHNIAVFLDTYAFLLFSIIFVVFCSAYWFWLIVGSEYFVWEVDENINCAKKVEHHKS